SRERLDATFAGLAQGRIASSKGRHFARARDQRRDPVQAAYELLVDGTAEITADSSVPAPQPAYANGESGEFVKANAPVPTRD
ncbi:2,3-bisphosphoglycerate-independent phosphoglycerate mutase, partial [Pseudomonas aeruginosa]